MKSNKKITSILLLSLSMISVISFAFAWFINNSDVSLGTENEFAIESGYSLTISRYKGAIPDPDNLDDSNAKIEDWTSYSVRESFATSTLKDITGDGYTFGTPYSLVTKFDEDDNVTGRDEAVFPMYEVESDNHDRYYIEEIVKFRTNMACSIYLSNESSITPYGATSVGAYDQTNMSVLLPSYSSNNIAGATRVAFLENSRESEIFEAAQGSSSDSDGGSASVTTNANTGLTLKQIWVPNSQYQLKYNELLQPIDFVIDGVREESYGYLSNNHNVGHETEPVENKYTVLDYVQKKLAIGNDVLYNSRNSFVNQAAPLLSFIDDSGEFVEKKLTIRIWVEGTDREANEAFNMGKFKVNLKFAAVSKASADADEENFLQGITLDTSNRKLKDSQNELITATNNVIYSVNGIDWYDYSTSIPATYQEVSNGTLVSKPINNFYIKLKETAIYEHSSYKYLTFGGE